MRALIAALMLSTAAFFACDGVEEAGADDELERDPLFFDGQVPYTECKDHGVNCNWSTQHCRRTLKLSGWKYYCAEGTNLGGTVYEGCARNPSSCGSNGSACVRRKETNNVITGDCQYLGCGVMPSLCGQKDLWGRVTTCVTTATITQPAGFPTLHKGSCAFTQRLTVYGGCLSADAPDLSKTKAATPHSQCKFGYRCVPGSEQKIGDNLFAVYGKCQKVAVSSGATWCDANGDCSGTMLCKDKCGSDALGSYSYGICVAQSQLFPPEGCDAPKPKTCAVSCTNGCNPTTGTCTCQSACASSCLSDGSCPKVEPTTPPTPTSSACPPAGSSTSNPSSLGNLAGQPCTYACWGKGTIYNICGADKWQFCLGTGKFASCQDIP